MKNEKQERQSVKLRELAPLFQKNVAQWKKPTYDIVIVGGLGHVGLPLGLVFANKKFRVCLYDVNADTAKQVRNGIMPFIEYGAEPILKKVLKNGNLEITTDAKNIAKAEHVIIAIGTPVDEYLNPRTRVFLESFARIKKYLHKEQTIIIRSSVYPNTCKQVMKLLGGREWKIAYCPERIVQGYAVKELSVLPQIIAGMTNEAGDSASALFGAISPKIIRASMGEAELTKLFSNAWRYIQFAVTNQFYMISEGFGVDYNKVRYAMTEGYGRAATLPTAGFAAGPCLLKDTMQLSAFSSNNFLLGHAAMMINEGLPNFIVEKLRKTHDLANTTVGILGMAFKADIDDIRDSLSYKLGKIFRFHGAEVLYSDEFAKDPTFVSKERLLALSDVVIIGVPHSMYKQLPMRDDLEIIDIWGVLHQ
jgi:UDP-N-acetyl-D-mannosaminuronic acid dehydrogenase